MFQAEYGDLSAELDEMVTSTLPELLLPPLSTAEFPVIMSINAGVGGSEASLFVEELARMYTRFAEQRGWRIEVMSQVEGPGGKGGGGFREITMKIDGSGEVYGQLQWERGVHRVQRVPATETMGRVHTSTVAVVVSELIG
jgi:peptide chain release factor 1